MHRVHNDDKNQRYTRKRWRRKEVPREDAKESAQQEQYQVICAKQRASTAEPESVTQGNLCVGIHSVGL